MTSNFQAIKNYFQKWNWTLFLVITCISYGGFAGNESVPTMKDVLILGTIASLVIGLPAAWLTGED